MRRRTKRVRLRARPFILVALFLNIAAGIAFSPVTSARHVRVEGAPRGDRPRLSGILQKLIGVPCARVNPRAIEAEALQNSELRGATLSRTPFGSAVLRVARRLPVARLYAWPDTGLSAEGVLYRATDLPVDLPTVNVPPEYLSVGLSLGNGWRSADVAHLAELVRGIAASEPPRIDLVGGSRVCLNIDGGIVDLGRCEDLDEKVARLRQILTDRPNLFATVLKLSLVRLNAQSFEPRPNSTAQGLPKP